MVRRIGASAVIANQLRSLLAKANPNHCTMKLTQTIKFTLPPLPLGGVWEVSSSIPGHVTVTRDVVGPYPNVVLLNASGIGNADIIFEALLDGGILFRVTYSINVLP